MQHIVELITSECVCVCCKYQPRRIPTTLSHVLIAEFYRDPTGLALCATCECECVCVRWFHALAVLGGYASILSVIYLSVTQTELIFGQIDKLNDYFGGLFVFVNAHQQLGAHDFVAVWGFQW